MQPAGRRPDKNNTSTADNKKEKKGTLTMTKLLAAAAAAITASLITTKLTSYVGSVLIVGISSIMIAILSEVYTRVIKKTKRFSAKVAYNAVPFEKLLPGRVANRIDEKLVEAMQATTTMEAVKADITPVDGKYDNLPADTAKVPESADYGANTGMYDSLENGSLAKLVQKTPGIDETAEKAAEHGNTANNDDNTKANDNTPVMEDSSDDNDNEDITGPSSFMERIKALSLNPITKGVMLFLAISMITSAMSWVVTTYVDKPNVTNVTVQETKVQHLSEDEKNTIKQQVKSEVSSQIAAAQQDANNASNSADSMMKRIDDLEKQVKSLQAESTDTNTTDGASTGNGNEIKDLQTQLQSLQSQITALQSQVNSLKANASTGDSNTTGSTASN